MSEQTEKPRIVCAANKYFIPLGDASFEIMLISARHWDSCMRDKFKRLVHKVDRETEVQGFIDQFGKFYTIQEAFVIADENNQIVQQGYFKPIVMPSVERAFTYYLADMVKALESPMIELPDDITDIDAFDAWLEQF